jgi:glycosyltransferase involved in cell wall biosynthesis
VKRSLAAALCHLPLVTCGGGWEGLAAGNAARGNAARFLPARNVREIMALMRRAKLVLNPLPLYYESHERPFQAMAAGAVAVVGSGGLFAAPEFAGAVLTMPIDPQESAPLIEAALADEPRLVEIALAGRRAQKAAHTWDHRARTLIDLAESLATC